MGGDWQEFCGWTSGGIEPGRCYERVEVRKKALSTPEGFLTEAQKNELAGVTGKARTFAVNELRSKYQDELSNEELRFSRDRGELRQQPLSFEGDSMAKVGLYSAAALQFSPLLNLERQQLEVLNRIANSLANPHDPINWAHRR
jgi:hypothetical protein